MKSTVKRGYRFALVQISIVGIAVTTSSGAMTTQAFGSGWSLKSSLTERMEFNDNIDQSSIAAKEAYGSTTSLSTSLGWQGRRQTVTTRSSFDIRRFYGPGARPGLDTFNHSHRFGYSVKRKTTTYSYSLSHSIQDATSSEFEDTGFVTQIDNNRITSSATASVGHDVNSRLKLNMTGSATSVGFEKSGANVTPYTDYKVNGSMVQKLSKHMTGTLSIGAGFYSADDLFNSESLTYRFTGRLATTFSRKLSAHIQAGVILTENNKDATSISLASSSDTIGSLFDIGMSYKMKRTALSVSASSSVAPSGSGGLASTTRVGFNISHKVDTLSNVSLSVALSQNDSGTSMSVSPLYSYKFAKKWNANLGYSYRQQDTNGVSTTSNNVFFSVTRAFTHLP